MMRLESTMRPDLRVRRFHLMIASLPRALPARMARLKITAQAARPKMLMAKSVLAQRVQSRTRPMGLLQVHRANPVALQRANLGRLNHQAVAAHGASKRHRKLNKNICV
jgi:hypothetical protein